MRSDEELFAIKERAAEQLMRIPGVTGVGLGGRETAGRPMGEISIKVFVSEKRPRAEVPPDEVIPETFEGVPTDVIALGEGEEEQGPPTGRAAVPMSNRDLDRYRPLTGGVRIEAKLPDASGGTLGCFLWERADHDHVYALTNQHVMTGSVAPTVADTKVGQPNSSDSVTKCCSNIVGLYAGGRKESGRDAAVVRLEAGMQWRPHVTEIGELQGTHALTTGEIAGLTYQVRKRGQRSRLTGGTVESINATWTVAGITHNNVTVVRPNPDPTLPAGTPIFFTQKGDSGSVYVNDDNEVVALHFAGRSSQQRSAGFGIAHILNVFRTREGLDLEVAVATTPGQVFTVPGSAMVEVPPEVAPVLTGVRTRERVLAPVGSGWLPGVAVPSPAMAVDLQADLDRTASGRHLINLWLRHQQELLELVNTNKRVAMVWHRSGGAALFQYATRMLTQPSLALPETLHGRPLSNVLDRLHQAFARFAGAELKADLDRARASLPDLAGRTYPQIVDALGTA